MRHFSILDLCLLLLVAGMVATMIILAVKI